MNFSEPSYPNALLAEDCEQSSQVWQNCADIRTAQLDSTVAFLRNVYCQAALKNVGLDLSSRVVCIPEHHKNLIEGLSEAGCLLAEALK